MMGVTHRVTGLCAGAYVAWGVRSLVLPAPAPLYACVAAVAAGLLLTALAGRAALWPDLDHHNSRATNSYGPISGLIHEMVQSWSCSVFDLTATPTDERAGNFREHRGLTHFAVTALVVGALAGVATWQLTDRRPVLVLGVIAGVLVGLVVDWMWTEIVGSLAGTAVAVAVIVTAPAYPVPALALVVGALAGLVVTGLLGMRLGTVAGVVTGGAAFSWMPDVPVDWTLVGDATAPGVGVGVGLAIATGMLAHSLGDGATRTGVPLLWPLVIRGQRYYPIHIRPRHLLLVTGEADWPEMKIRAWSWALLVLAVLGWWPGLWTVLWELIPWPWVG